MGVAQAFEHLVREQVLGHLDLLQAQHIRLFRFQKTHDLIGA